MSGPMEPGSTQQRHRHALDRPRITRAAVELLDEVGLAGLSTRRLAARLGVRSPTLYWHVKNKEELLDLVAEAICADAIHIDEGLPWPDQLISGLRQFRTLLLAHRDSAALLRERPPTGPHRLGHIETTLGILLRAGFDEEEAVAISQLLTAHVLSSVEGFTSRNPPKGEAPGRTGPSAESLESHPYLRRSLPAFGRVDAAQVFEEGAEIIIDGLIQRIERRSP